MDLRTTIRRARAVAALYLTAYIDAEVAYKNSDEKDWPERLSALASYRDATEIIVCTIGSWAKYEMLREGTTIGGMLAESGVGLEEDGRAAWRAQVGADLDSRIHDPKGTKRTPLPVPAFRPRVVADAAA